MIKNISLIISLLFSIGCEPYEEFIGITYIDLDPRLEVDNNGYYHLTLAEDSWQTLHRFSGTAYIDGFRAENVRLEWESSHYWYLGDTVGYVIKRGLTDDLEYVIYDTIYITGFNGTEIPTINPASYSSSSGEFNQMFAPVGVMLGDTVAIQVTYSNLYYNDTVETFYVVLD